MVIDDRLEMLSNFKIILGSHHEVFQVNIVFFHNII